MGLLCFSSVYANPNSWTTVWEMILDEVLEGKDVSGVSRDSESFSVGYPFPELECSEVYVLFAKIIKSNKKKFIGSDPVRQENIFGVIEGIVGDNLIQFFPHMSEASQEQQIKKLERTLMKNITGEFFKNTREFWKQHTGPDRKKPLVLKAELSEIMDNALLKFKGLEKIQRLKAIRDFFTRYFSVDLTKIAAEGSKFPLPKKNTLFGKL